MNTPTYLTVRKAAQEYDETFRSNGIDDVEPPTGDDYNRLFDIIMHADMLDEWLSYHVVEDNAGGLHLFVWQGEDCIFACYNLEFLAYEDFQASLRTIEGDDPNGIHLEIASWDSQLADPESAWREMFLHTKYEIIASYDYHHRVEFPRRMGRAGRRAFGYLLD